MVEALTGQKHVDAELKMWRTFQTLLKKMQVIYDLQLSEWVTVNFRHKVPTEYAHDFIQSVIRDVNNSNRVQDRLERIQPCGSELTYEIKFAGDKAQCSALRFCNTITKPSIVGSQISYAEVQFRGIVFRYRVRRGSSVTSFKSRLLEWIRKIINTGNRLFKIFCPKAVQVIIDPSFDIISPDHVTEKAKIAIIDEAFGEEVLPNRVVNTYSFTADHIITDQLLNRGGRHGLDCLLVAMSAAPGHPLVAYQAIDKGYFKEDFMLFQSLIAKSIYHAAVSEPDVAVICCSLGDQSMINFPLSRFLEDAIAFAANNGRGDKGIPIVWAASYTHQSKERQVATDELRRHPAIISVGAVDKKDKIALTGPSLYLDLLAPGYSEATRGASGTSLAAPHVAALIARMLAANSELSRLQIHAILRTTAIKRIGVQTDHMGFHQSCGYGNLNPEAALKEDPDSPRVKAMIERLLLEEEAYSQR